MRIFGFKNILKVFKRYVKLNRFGFCNKNKNDNILTNVNINSKHDEYIPDFELDNLKSVASQCSGCGVILQSHNKNMIGYIPEEKIKSFINNMENPKEKIEELNEFEKITDIKLLKKIKNTSNSLICERCYKLKHYMNFDNIDDNHKKIDYTHLVKKINSEILIQQIIARISDKSTVLYVCDITEIEATINTKMLKMIADKKGKILFIINKFDILPLEVNQERIKIWIGERLKELTKELNIEYSYTIVSSKNGYNFDYIIYKLKKLKELAKEEKSLKPKIYIIGNANVGKSSFINKLIERTNRYEEKLPLYKKNYNIDTNALTTSPLPGTTIGITKVEPVRMGLKFFDTPGIPNKSNITFYMDNYVDIIASTITKKIIPYNINVKQGYSIWLGAVVRIDFNNGEDKYFSFFLSHNVTIHKTNMLNADDIFTKHAGGLLRPCITKEINNLKLKKWSFNLVCDKFSLLNYDISISGLGWFSISGKGFIQLDVFAPEGVAIYLRNKPLMPYEIKKSGVKRHYGKTINSKSKLNRK